LVSSCQSDQTIRIWDMKNITEFGRPGGHCGDVNALTLVPDRRKLVSLSSDQSIRLWDVKTGAESGRIQIGVHAPRALAYLPGDRLAVGDNDSTIGLWSLETRTEIIKLEFIKDPVLDDPFRMDKVSAMTLLPNSKLAAGHWAGPIRLWDLNEYIETAQLRGHKSVVWSMAVLPDGRLASASGDKTVRIWDSAANIETDRLEGHLAGVRALAVLPEGRLASASYDNTIILWDLTSAREVVRLIGHTGKVTALAVTNGKLASGSTDGTIRLWDLTTFQDVQSFQLGATVLCLAAIPGGDLVAGVAIEHPKSRMHWLTVARETS
jgi:WD40 repeat protein